MVRLIRQSFLLPKLIKVSKKNLPIYHAVNANIWMINISAL
jgi:hypothetical protein